MLEIWNWMLFKSLLITGHTAMRQQALVKIRDDESDVRWAKMISFCTACLFAFYFIVNVLLINRKKHIYARNFNSVVESTCVYVFWRRSPRKPSLLSSPEVKQSKAYFGLFSKITFTELLCKTQRKKMFLDKNHVDQLFVYTAKNI